MGLTQNLRMPCYDLGNGRMRKRRDRAEDGYEGLASGLFIAVLDFPALFDTVPMLHRVLWKLA